ncbi:MAG TPA: GAP family protein [Solirubrobacteraceae bacterium]
MELVLLALYAALYPTLLAAVVVLLSQPRRLRLLSAYLAGGMVVSIGLGLAIVAALEDSHEIQTSRSGLSWGADLAIGGLVLLVAVALATRADERLRARRAVRHPPRRDVEDREPWSQRILARGSAPIVFAVGLAINIPGASYLIALKDIAAGHHPAGVVVFQVVVFNLIMFLLAEIPLLGLLLAPARTDALVARMDHWLSANGRRIAVVVSGLLGVFLIARGIAHA